MSTNNFKAFAVGSGANVTSQADYEALTALLSGFQSGKASSAQINKALRQGSTIAAVLAQFITDKSGNDVLDNGNTSTILTNLIAALKANAAGSNANYFSDTGAANAIVIAPVPAMTALVDGQVFDISCAAANTGAVTLKVNALTAYPVVGSAGALKGGEIGVAKGVIRVVRSATNNNFMLMAQNTSGPIQVSPATQPDHALQLQQAIGRLINVRVISASTTYVPTAGTTKIVVEAIGGGGGGGGSYTTSSGQRACAGGGGAGGYGRALFTSGFSNISITIGNGGSGGSANTASAGSSGGATSFGSLLICSGGTGGTFSSNWALPIHTSGAPSGTATTGANLGTFSAPAGAAGYYANNGWLSGAGASSPLGRGGVQIGGTSAGQAATGFGSGGGGAATGESATGQAGGAGSNGVVIVWEYA